MAENVVKMLYMPQVVAFIVVASTNVCKNSKVKGRLMLLLEDSTELLIFDDVILRINAI